MLPNGPSRTNEMRRRPPSFWTLFLFPLSFRTNFPLSLESRNLVALPLLQRPQSQANVNDVQRTDISFFFLGWAWGGGSFWVTFLCLLDSEQLSPSAEYTTAGSRGRAAKPKCRVSADGRSEVRVRRKSPVCDSAGVRESCGFGAVVCVHF